MKLAGKDRGSTALSYSDQELASFERARELAVEAHAKQQRKYTGGPYSDHPIRVSKEAERLGLSPEAVMAAALHDVWEDSPEFAPRVATEFGKGVEDMVRWLTNPSKGSPLPRSRRKQMDRDHLSAAPLEVKVVKALDRIDNLMEMGGAPVGFRFKYSGESLLLADALVAGGSSVQLDELVARLRKAALELGTSQF